ncbi:hypothetical protein B0H14DRAFT_3424980 [Mycena olivaceomarginata]|nr:hypothetical protein B0H14DRAFT_3424980 [Mycena olivaceomarginata]
MLAAVLVANALMTLLVASMALPAYSLAFFSFGRVQNNGKPGLVDVHAFLAWFDICFECIHKKVTFSTGPHAQYTH